MGQYWEFINLDKLQILDFPGGGYKLGEGFWQNSGGRCATLASLLRIRNVPSDFCGLDKLQKDFHNMKLSFQTRSRKSPFSTKIPEELLIIIIKELDYLELICMSFTSKYVFFLCQRPLLEILSSVLEENQCAGDRIVIVGDYLNFVPERMLPSGLTVDELEVTSDSEGDEEKGISNSERDEEKIISFNLYSYANEKFIRYFDFNLGLREERNEVLMEFRSIPFNSPFKSLPQAWLVQKMGCKNLLHAIASHISKEPDAILRNLITHEFVKNSSISHPGGTCYGAWNSGPIGFVEVLKCMICFSDVGDINMPLDGPEDLHRGPWAGHSFDILNITDFQQQQLKDEQKWIDVSATIREKVKRVWDSDEDNLKEFGAYPLVAGKKVDSDEAEK